MPIVSQPVRACELIVEYKYFDFIGIPLVKAVFLFLKKQVSYVAIS